MPSRCFTRFELAQHPGQFDHGKSPEGVSTVLPDIGLIAHDALNDSGVA